MKHMVSDAPALIIESYKKAVSIQPNEEFGDYCCVCSPSQFTAGGDYAPFDEAKRNKWHNEFKRVFLPLNEWETDDVGNLRNKKTHDTDFRKHAVLQPPNTK